MIDSMFLSSLIALGGLGLLFGAGLAFAAKKFAVQVDPKITKVLEVLPGANCGACGQPGCAAFAEAVVAGRVPPNRCAPGGPETAAKIADILGITDLETEEAKVAVVQCRGGRAEAKERFIYQGVEDCTAALLVGGGSKACIYGCLGLGSCAKACPFDAIHMNENGLPVVDENKCTGCGVCVLTCPRNILALIPRSQPVYLACTSQDKAKAVKSICSVGCFTCKICVNPKFTPNGSIEMVGNLPRIKDPNDPEIAIAVEKCPANCYVVRGKLQIPETVSQEQENSSEKG
ncbi:Fe-S cluster domain-containing protein [candidate division KSB1 bacterium]|nr:Fe-S cluster domain-containing protein [candidate division KSB1 bacterium]